MVVDLQTELFRATGQFGLLPIRAAPNIAQILTRILLDMVLKMFVNVFE